MSYIAELRNTTKTYGAIPALDDISLHIHKGEILALLGPNGSGKSTLLRIMAFIDAPSNGEVYFSETKVTGENIQQFRMQSTMVFQKITLFNTTVYNNIAYGLKVRKTPKKQIEEKVSQALRLVRLEGFQLRHAKKLSGGEQQRVALARALVLDTKLLLLDEPTANLDPKNAAIVEEVINTVNREKQVTIVLATHNMFQAENLPHRLALMNKGKITEIGTPIEIFGRLSKNLASFAATENTFTGTSVLMEDGNALIDIGKEIKIVATTNRIGEVSAFVSPEDIIVSMKNLQSSARNNFKGRIVEVQDLGSLAKLKVDIGRIFTVQITKRSFNEMGLNLSSEVVLAFKASSVQII